MRRCSKCKKTKVVSQFYQRSDQIGNYKSWCRLCHNEDTRQRNSRRRMEALRHYGGLIPLCACCGENEIKFLAIDHINGGGNKHRKLKATGMIGVFLKANNYPKGFQVLCHNCNQAKGFYGKCPHQN